MTDNNQQRYRPGVHIYLYLWVGLLVVSIVPALLISSVLFDTTHMIEGLVSFGVLLAAFQGLFWYARRRCSAEDLSAWDGLLYITSYMTIGVGTMSLFLAVPCAIVAVLGLVGIAIVSLGSGASVPQRWFRSMVIWFGRHRMYQ
ncbi:MAG TPA: hypothetical protein VMF52_16305 [Steroidobacteraceae bacterium]|nr:hypothetical protein [Steroidobacteraceae bacterium]